MTDMVQHTINKHPIMRESGYYWVRVSEQANMEISLYIQTLRKWAINGVSGFVNDEHWFEIGQRIPDNETLKKLSAKSISPVNTDKT